MKLKMKRIFFAIIVINTFLILDSVILRKLPRFGHSSSDVYDWAQTNLDYSVYNELFMTEKRCRELIDTACNEYGVTPPKLNYKIYKAIEINKEQMITGTYHKIDHIITIYMLGNKASTVLHECVHAIINKRSGLIKEIFDFHFSHSHNRKFMSVYYNLLVECGNFDSLYLDRAMKKHGIKK